MKMKKVYWDDFRQLLKTKNGEYICSCRRMANQLRCAAKGHNFVFDSDKGWERSGQGGVQAQWFSFKCTGCGLEIHKTEDELTAPERDALKKLKLLNDKKENENEEKKR